VDYIPKKRKATTDIIVIVKLCICGRLFAGIKQESIGGEYYGK